MTAPVIVDKRHHIMEEATRLFVKHGYDGISMREIGEACQISKPGLYYHFKDKEDLLLDILNDNMDHLSALVSESRSLPGTARQRIEHLADGIFTRLPGDQRAVIRMANQEMNKLSPAARSVFGQRYQTEFLDGVATIFKESIEKNELRDEDPLLMTWVLLGMLYPFFNPELQRQPDVIERILKLFFEGLLRRE